MILVLDRAVNRLAPIGHCFATESPPFELQPVRRPVQWAKTSGKNRVNSTPCGGISQQNETRPITRWPRFFMESHHHTPPTATVEPVRGPVRYGSTRARLFSCVSSGFGGVSTDPQAAAQWSGVTRR